MDALVRYFSETQCLATPLVGDPSATLLECGPQFLGVLLSAGCYQNSWTPELYLEDVTWFRAARYSFLYSRIGRVRMCDEDGRSAARHEPTQSILPNLSAIPHRTVFLSAYNYNRLEKLVFANKGRYFFQNMQRCFGKLPGFRTDGDALTAPDGYAEIAPPENGAMRLVA